MPVGCCSAPPLLALKAFSQAIAKLDRANGPCQEPSAVREGRLVKIVDMKALGLSKTGRPRELMQAECRTNNEAGERRNGSDLLRSTA